MKTVMFPGAWALIHKSECQSKSRQNRPYTRLLLRTVTEESKLINIRSWIPLDHPLPTWPGRQAIWSLWSPFPYRFMSQGGGGCHRRGGRFSGLNDKPDTDGQSCLTIPYTSQGFQIKISDRMRWITRERAYLAIHYCVFVNTHPALLKKKKN